MNYEEIISLINERNLNGKNPTLSYEEAVNYYGTECCNLLRRIFEYLKKANYVIYQHATNLESADNILKKGFIVETSEIDNIPLFELLH